MFKRNFFPKKNKYKATRTAEGYDSKLEQAVGAMLHFMEKAGEIKDIRRQHRVELSAAKIACKIDFSYTDVKTNQTIFIEAKGLDLERWRIIKKLWAHYGPGRLEVWKGTYKCPKLHEIIIPE